MNIRPQTSEEPEINLTSLIDVVFLLLIFFMVSTSFVREADLQIELPKASLTPHQKSDQRLTVTISAEGRYYIQDQEVVNQKPETLKRALEKITDGNLDQPLVVRADGLASHQSVVTVLDVAGQMGLTNIAIETVKSSSQEAD